MAKKYFIVAYTCDYTANPIGKPSYSRAFVGRVCVVAAKQPTFADLEKALDIEAEKPVGAGKVSVLSVSEEPSGQKGLPPIKMIFWNDEPIVEV